MKNFIPVVFVGLMLITGFSCQNQPRDSEAAGRAEAVRLTEEGMQIWLYDSPHHTLSTFERSAALFEEAIAQDSTYAMAHASLVHPAMMMNWQKPDEAEALEAQAREAAEKAMIYGPELADAYYAQSLVAMMFDNDFEKGGELITKAAEMAPDNAYIQREYAIYQYRIGNVEESMALRDKAAMLDPEFGVGQGGNCEALRVTGRHDEALELGLALNPKPAGIINCVAWIYYGSGQYDEALAIFEEGISSDPSNPNFAAGKAYTLLQQGEYDQAIELFTASENEGGIAIAKAHQGGASEKNDAIALLEQFVEDGQWGWDMWLADLYDQIGEREKSLELYEKGFDTRAALPRKEAILQFVWALKNSVQTESVRNEPRIQALFEKPIA